MLNIKKESIEQSADSLRLDSFLIDWMRFPLAVLVVFIHVPRSQGYFIQWLCSDVICSMAVPLFFVISGYLYFINITDLNSPKEWYVRKSISRIKSILIPYVFWALLPILIFALKKVVGMIIHQHGHEMLFDGLSRMNFYHILWEAGNGGPEDMSLWFLRNLLIVSLFTPPPMVLYKVYEI